MSQKRVAALRIGRLAWALALLPGLMILAGCGGSSSSPSSSGNGSGGSGGGSAVNNTQAVQVNLGPLNNDADVLFTSVTICTPGTTNCETIPDVQVDTGSEGLRLLASEISIPLTQVNDSSGSPLGNCVTFADNSYVWGPVETADVEMASEKAPSVPIQIIGDTNFPAVPHACNSGGSNDDTVAALGANGLLGVGVFRHDCGAGCAGSVSTVPNIYFGCPSSGCAVASVPLNNQLQNPVWLFASDNNGLLISLPSIPSSGAATVSGSMIFGIGTQSDNALGAAKVYTTDGQGNFTTVYNGATYSSSYIDTGSNGIFFLSASTIGIPACTDGNTGFSCPTSTQNLTATNTGVNGTSGQVSFSIANAGTLFNSGNSAFNDLGGPDSGQFDWGLAFFFGRNIFIAINTQTTPAGQGPYWAY